MATLTTSPRAGRALSQQLAAKIERLILDDELPVGTALAERALAERFNVSRSPVREALQRLSRTHVVGPREGGGYVVRSRPQGQAILRSMTLDGPEEAVYLKIADDHLAGKIPERISESDLLRRYGTTKSLLAKILRRISEEGWIERLPGHGWHFLPVLTSAETYDQAYQFRLLIEPAALSQATFTVDEAALRRCLAEQQALIDGAIEWASPAQVFDANTRLHETIAGFSGNVFIMDSLRRINRLRRLMEYRNVVDREAVARRCREHKVLVELLLSGQRAAAAEFLRLHLRDAAQEKSKRAPPANA